MASTIDSYKPSASVLDLYSTTYTLDILIKILAENVLAALELQAMVLCTMFDLNNNAKRALTIVENETFPQLTRPEDVIKPCWERMDVNAEELKTVEHSEGKKGKRKKKSDRDREARRREREEKGLKREAEEKERLRKWEECWEKKLQAEEERDKAECCMSKGLCLKPRTQSNIWINVVRDRSMQEIHMAFKHVPVPRPKPPPLPPLKKQKESDNTRAEKSIVQKVDKKSSTTTRKKK